MIKGGGFIYCGMKHLPLFIATLLGIAISSCHRVEQRAEVLFINASYNAPILDFYLQGDKAQGLISFANNTNTHQAEKLKTSEPFTCEVKESYGGNTVFSLSNPGWVDKGRYTLFLYGDYALKQYDWVTDTFTAPAAGKLKVRFMNLGPDAPAVDVFFNATQVADSLLYYGIDKTHAVGSFIEIPAGSYSITVNDHNGGTNLLTLPPIQFQDNRVLDVYTCGLLTSSSTPFQLGFAAH